MSKNHPTDNIYNILGKLKALEPTPAEVVKEKAQQIRESVESQGSILKGLREVSSIEQRLQQQFAESQFEKVSKAIQKTGKSKASADAIAAAAGRKKLGQKEMTRRSVAGRKKANETLDGGMGNMGECAMCEAGTCTEHDHLSENGLQRYTGIKKYGKKGFEALQKAGREGTSEEEKGRIKDKYLPKKEVDEERETLATKHGKIYKGGTYGTEYDVSKEGNPKPKRDIKHGQKGRPKAEKPMDAKAAPKGDIFGRTTGEVPKGKKGTRIAGKGNIDTVNESMNFQALAKKHGMGMDECMNTLNDHYKKYQMTGECSDLLNGAMQLHRHHMEEGGPVPYEVPAVQRKAAGAAPLTPKDVQAQDAARSMHPPKLDAPKPAVHDELDELAKLAGITDEGAGIMHYKDEKAKEAGEDHFTLGGKTFPVKESDDELANIIHGHTDAVEHFKQGGELDYDLESDLWDYYFNKGEIRNYDADASEFIARRFAEDLGIDEGNAFGLAVQQTPPGEEIKIDGKPTGEIKKENAALNELAKLAGLQVSEMNEDEDKCCCDDKGEENCPVHGHDHNDHLDEADAPVDEPEEEYLGNAHSNKYFSLKNSTMNPGEGDAGEKAMHPDRPTFKNGDNALAKPAKNESVIKLEARLAREYESIKKKA